MISGGLCAPFSLFVFFTVFSAQLERTSVVALPQLRQDAQGLRQGTRPTRCQVDAGVLLTGMTINSYAGVANPSACCALCSTSEACVAWTITGETNPAQQVCELKSSLGQQQLTPNATSGILGNASKFTTHYGNPYPSTASANGTATACQHDEIEFEMNGVRGSFCSPACTGDGTTDGHCPSDRPPGVTADPQCILRDSVGSGSHCALVCKSDADCGSSAKCVTKFDDAVCVYPLDHSSEADHDLNVTEKMIRMQLAGVEQELTEKLKDLSDSIEKNVSALVHGVPKLTCTTRSTNITTKVDDDGDKCGPETLSEEGLQDGTFFAHLLLLGTQCGEGEVLQQTHVQGVKVKGGDECIFNYEYTCCAIGAIHHAPDVTLSKKV